MPSSIASRETLGASRAPKICAPEKPYRFDVSSKLFLSFFSSTHSFDLHQNPMSLSSDRLWNPQAAFPLARAIFGCARFQVRPDGFQLP
jgi:hypothetical protein